MNMKRDGMKCIAQFTGEEVKGITTFRNKLIIATTKGVYSYPKPRKVKK
jgi:hypothetical protein